MGRLNRLLSLVLRLYLLFLLFSREPIFAVFGTGTGINKTKISPISLVSNFIFQKNHGKINLLNGYPKIKHVTEEAFRGFHIPGEIYLDGLDGFQKSIAALDLKKGKFDYMAFLEKFERDGSHAFVEVNKHKGLSKLTEDGESQLIIIGAILMFVAPFTGVTSAVFGGSASDAGLFMMFATGVLYVALNMSPSVGKTLALTDAGMNLLSVLLFLTLAVEVTKPRREDRRRSGSRSKTKAE